ncbi:hypothetical protein ACHQM5_023526 [Ranunculus cassubicifolius]
MSSSSPNPTPQSSSPNTPQPLTSIPKKVPPLPWTHLETVNLIEAYQEKWYSLKRGQLKASQWEEVAGSVATRCGFKELSKTATQCRHKMEKLRKRYRGEKQRGVVSVWNYFEMMDMMERGPFPISAARPINLMPPQPPPSRQSRRTVNNDNSSEEDEEEGEDEEDDEVNKSRSINHILRRPPVASPIFDALPLPNKYGGIGGVGGGGGGSGSGNGSGPGVSRFLRNPMFRKRKRSYEVNDMEEEEDEEEGEAEGGRLLSELASVIRSFGEGFVKVENMKLEMMKETEMHRIEMEKKRMEMILESQRCIVDAIAKTFDSHNKSKKTRET